MAKQGGEPVGQLLDQKSIEVLRRVVRDVLGTEMPSFLRRWQQPSLESTGIILGKTNASSTEGSTVGVSIWSGSAGSEADSTFDISAYNWFGTIASGTKVILAHNGSYWYITNAKCP